MSARLFFFLSVVPVFLASSALSQPQQPLNATPTDLFYSGFHSHNLTLNGSAAIQDNGVLKLTKDTTRSIGHAFAPAPIRFKKSRSAPAFSFSTSFVLAIVPEYPKLGGHGLAFAFSRDRDVPGALPSQYLGLLGVANNSNLSNSNQVVAVEFDTVKDFEFRDINDNHVGIDLNSLTSNASAPAASVADDGSKHGFNLTSGQRIMVWVDYDSRRHLMNVMLSLTDKKPKAPTVSLSVDLTPYVEEFMYVGFTASTGVLASSHYIFGWSFRINDGEPRPLSLSSLPSLPVQKKRKSSASAMVAVVSVAATLAVAISVFAAAYLIRRIRNADVIEAWELDIGPHRFSYRELKRATRNFRDKELLGFGGFGRVYKGTLPSTKTIVAVKRISHESKQGLREFVSEIASIGRLRHRNLVQLLGWCRRRGDLLLVYDFMPNGSLDKHLFDEAPRVLSWDQRFKIIKDVALGLLYLHEEWEQVVIHRDIKAANVLLDSDLNGRLGDFGLAKLYEHGSNPSTTRVVGTLGYLAPELTRSGRPTAMSDVFAFGALLLEVVCGRRPIEPKNLPEELVLVDWVWDKWQSGVILEVVDPKLMGECVEAEAVAALKLGLMCSNSVPTARPTMRQVVSFLEGEVDLPEDVPAPEGAADKRENSGRSVRFSEDFVHSYPGLSFFEKLSTTGSSSGGCGAGDDGDIAAALAPSSLCLSSAPADGR